VQKARRHSKKLWLGNTWPKAIHKLEWLIERFAPVPDWENYDFSTAPPLAPSGVPSRTPSESPKPSLYPKRGLVYYTDNHGDQELLEICRIQTLRCMEEWGFPIVSVSHKPTDFGKNIVVDFERAVLSIFKQILIGCQESDAEVLFLLEHDLLYHPSHFDFLPPDKKVFFYDQNRWSVCDETGKAVFYHTDVPSMVCAHRDLLIKHYTKAVNIIEKDGWKSRYGYSPPKGLPREQRIARRKDYMAEFPSLDIRREDSWSRKRMDKSQFRSEKSCRGWTEAYVPPEDEEQVKRINNLRTAWGPTYGKFNEFMQDVKEGKLWQKKLST
jgi:hypothetical protein